MALNPLDGISVLKMYLFGTTDVPVDFNLRVRDADAPESTVTADGASTLTTGEGRYAWLSRSNLVENFFNLSYDLPPGQYDISSLSSYLSSQYGVSYLPSRDLFLPINNYGTDPESSDYAQRALILGSAGATLNAATFVVSETGERSIESASLSMNQDNFDLESSSDINIINALVLQPTFDPYGLGKKVIIDFANNSTTEYAAGSGYTYEMFLADQNREEQVGDPLATVLANVGTLDSYKGYIQSDPILAYHEAGYYGTEKDVVYVPSGGDPGYSTNQSYVIAVGGNDNNIFSIFSDYGAEVYASGGDDLIDVVHTGRNYFDGYSGVDTVDYEFSQAQASARTKGLDITVPASGLISVSEISGATSSDLLNNIERLDLTSSDDVVQVSGIIDTLEVYGEGYKELGNLVDFSNLDQAVNISNTDYITVSKEGTFESFLGFQNVVGTTQGDGIVGSDGGNRIEGDLGDDTIDGGDGANLIYGGDGNDQITYTAGKNLIYGDAGDDVIYGAAVNFSGDPVDGVYPPGFEPWAPQTPSNFIDGGTGNDVLVCNGVAEPPEICVGELNGEVAVVVAYPGSTDVAVGVEQVSGVSLPDFSAYYDGISADLSDTHHTDYGDMVTFNMGNGAHSIDVSFDGGMIGSGGNDTLTASADHPWIDGDEGDDVLTGTNGGYLQGRDGNDTLTGGLGTGLYGDAGNDVIHSGGGGSSLSGGSGSDVIYAKKGDIVSGDKGDKLYFDGLEITGNNRIYSANAHYTSGSPINDIIGSEFAVFVAPAPLQTVLDKNAPSDSDVLWVGYLVKGPSASNFDSNHWFIRSTADLTINFQLGDFGLTVDSSQIYDMWNGSTVMTGGQFTNPLYYELGDQNGSVIDDTWAPSGDLASYSGFNMSDLTTFFDYRDGEGTGWTPDGVNFQGGGGSNSTPPTNVNLVSGSGSTTVSDFNPQTDVVTIDGTTVDPAGTQSGISIAQVGSDVRITFGSGDIVTLTSVSLTDWVTAASSEILGSSASETLTGTAAGELIADGAGNDTIAAGGGDDTIVYGSGDDFIVGKGNVGNPGDDVLDLSRYSSDQVVFSINGENAQIVTPDGTITLEWQAHEDIGGASNNIQHVLFSDGALDEAGIKARALADQSTSGDDVITGTGFDDLIAGSGGNDSISLGSGNDTVVYASGNDSISGGAGDDVLDLSKYSSDQVAFSVSGKDVLVATPDGTITLTFELNKPVGDVNSNIEHVLFSNGSLDEAGIRARAVNDQGTAGNDYVYGTAYDDLINGSAGDDTIAAGGGDDTIAYASGNDFIVGKGNIGNPGDDVLDLSKYSSNQVVFSINGENAQIVTPDGTITLEWQAREDLGGASNNIQHVLFSDGALDETGIKARALADQSTPGDDLITGTGFDDLIWGSLGNDSVSAGSGNDTIVYAAGNDSISGGAGQDVLDLSKYTSSQVRFAISGKDIVAATPDGKITLTFEVNKPVGDVTSNIEQILFSDGSLDEAGIRTRAIDDQSTSGNDYIYGSPQNDLIVDGLGNDSIAAGAGNDTIVYDAGNDLIVGKGNIGNPADDVLDLSKYSSDQVRFSANVDNAKIVTPDGTITLEFQTRNPIGSGANIEHILFSDGALDEAGIKARAMADQGTAGNDVITGTRQADLIVGGTGNDTMSGSYGADTFAFAVGDGIDSISDFSATEDLLQFQGLAFSDLAIGQTGNDATIQYGLSDQITLHGVNSATLSPNRFLFA